MGNVPCAFLLNATLPCNTVKKSAGEDGWKPYAGEREHGDLRIPYLYGTTGPQGKLLSHAQWRRLSSLLWVRARLRSTQSW